MLGVYTGGHKKTHLLNRIRFIRNVYKSNSVYHNAYKFPCLCDPHQVRCKLQSGRHVYIQILDIRLVNLVTMVPKYQQHEFLLDFWCSSSCSVQLLFRYWLRYYESVITFIDKSGWNSWVSITSLTFDKSKICIPCPAASLTIKRDPWKLLHLAKCLIMLRLEFYLDSWIEGVWNVIIPVIIKSHECIFLAS